MAWQRLPELVDERLVQRVAHEAIGGRPLELIKLRQTRRRVTYEVRFGTAATKAAFLKLEVSSDYGFPALALEEWAMARAMKVGVPAARVIGVDCSEERYPFRWLASAPALGESLEVTAIEPRARDGALRDAGALLARLHTIGVDGFGPLRDDLYLDTGRVRGSTTTWRASLISEAEQRAARLCDADVVDHHQVESVLAIVADGTPELAHGCLLHGDIQPGHLFVEASTGRVSGLIDFGDRQSGDPEWEFSWVALREEPAFLDALSAGYRDAGGELDERRLRCYLALRMLWWIERCYEEQRLDQVAGLKERLTQLVQP